jgi:ribosomal protein S8
MNQSHAKSQENFHTPLSNNLMPRYDALSCKISKLKIRVTQCIKKQNFLGIYKASFHSTKVYMIRKYIEFIHSRTG